MLEWISASEKDRRQKGQMMQSPWIEDERCTACGACMNACPVDALFLDSDSCGFSHPQIGRGCIDCGLCKKVCDSRANQSLGGFEAPRVYAAWSRQESLRFESTSGGLFSELALEVLRRGGCVYGAFYNDDNMVSCGSASDETGLAKLRQSKYVQSDIGYAFRKVESDLDSGLQVLFCGCPCQVAGLKAFLGKNCTNLLTVDFICRGVNSPKAYRSWLNEIEEQKGAKAKRVWFKYKSGGWKKSPKCTKVEFEDGTHRVFDQEGNLYMIGYLGYNLYIRPSCSACEFKGLPRCSDLTLADFWGLDKSLDDDKGASLLLVNTEKGFDIFRSIENQIVAYKRNMSEVLSGNMCLEKSVNFNPKSSDFLEMLDYLSFSKAFQKYTKKSLLRRIASWLLG